MSPDPHNPPLPGKDIEATPAEPPYNRAARGETEAKPEVLRHNLNLTPRVPALTPDGRAVTPGRSETQRQDALAARGQRIQPGIEKDGAARDDLSKLQRDFDNANHNRR